MNVSISTSQVTKHCIKCKGLDPISVFVEEFGQNQARVTIECFNKSWSYFWGSMGMRIYDFFDDVPYLANKFCRDETTITDYKKIGKLIGVDPSELQHNLWAYSNELALANIDLYDLPVCATDEYKYLISIVTAVAEGFKLFKARQKLTNSDCSP